MANEYDYIVKRVRGLLEGDGWHEVDANIIHDIVRWLKTTRRQHSFTSVEITTAYDILKWKAEENARA